MIKIFKVLHNKEQKFDGVQFGNGRVVILRSEKQVESWDSEQDMLAALGEGHEVVWDK